MFVPAVVSLDDRSRRTVAEFAVHVSIASALVVGLCILGLRPWAGAGRLLALLFSFYGLITFFRAARSGDKLGGPSLNLWDEAIALNGCAFLLQAVLRN